MQSFMKELSNYLEKENNEISKTNNNINNLKQENCLFQVVEIGTDGAYLQNINNNRVSKETDISKEILDKIGEDFVLRYQNGNYIIEEELTQSFFDSLVEIEEYKKIQDEFIKDSNILEISPDTKYKIEIKDENYSILSYGNDDKIKVPNELIPFWSNIGENLSYENGKFNRDI